MLKKRIIFGLGSNIGDREAFLNEAIDKLVISFDLANLKKSKILENKALLLPDSPDEWDIDFYNLVIAADIDVDIFDALSILEIVKRIEVEIGRIDRGRWGPREIDIDILAIDNLVIDFGEKLQIPHKELFNRDFFIDPFKEIEPKLLENIRTCLKSSAF